MQVSKATQEVQAFSCEDAEEATVTILNSGGYSLFLPKVGNVVPCNITERNTVEVKGSVLNEINTVGPRFNAFHDEEYYVFLLDSEAKYYE